MRNATPKSEVGLEWLPLEKIISVPVDAYAVKEIRMKLDLKILSK